ncbi:response regulator transcription factor [Actinokineospora spheciospongiae]|uniref:response regulator transcription factor n=1 Tax=Actinokineospora spheciospongiae TaxID=909613 RepID=UPI000D70D9C2|nr:response regulator transcription factor [Actinokineospora spheciospongiae]PWW63286.1 LuxR family two component transcriptional regulator [Actinokineospora spheciospongiae]
MPERPTTRVVLAEDHYLVREGTRLLLEDSGEVEVVAAVGNAVELLHAVGELRPDAVVTDIRMPPGHRTEGITAAHTIRAEHPGTGVVVLSQHADESYVFALFRDGTAGLAYLLKERVGDLDHLLGAIKEVRAGRSSIDPRVVDILLRGHSRAADSPLSRLTKREYEVLRLMAQGHNNRAIAAALVIAESTVEKHGHSTFAKLGLGEEDTLHRRVSAVLTYLRHDPPT